MDNKDNKKDLKKIFNVLFIAVFSAMLGLGIVAPLMPIFAESLGATGIWLGIIFSAFSFSRAILMPIIGKISDKKGRKRFIVFGLFFYSLASFLYIFAPNVYWLTFIRVIHGLASAMVLPVAMAYIGEIAPSGKEGKTMGTFNISLFLGMGSGPFLGGILNKFFGMNSVFLAMGFLTTLSFFVVVLFLPDIKIKKQKNIKPISFKKALKNKAVKSLVLFRILGAIGRGGLMAFLPIFAASINIGSAKVGIALSVMILLTALLQRPFGKVADKYNKFHLVLAGTIISDLMLFLIPGLKNFWLLMTLVVIMGVAGALSMPAATAIIVKIGNNIGMGSSMGIFSTSMSVGMILAPLVSGLVMDYMGIKYIFPVAGIISFVGTYFFYYYFKKALKEKEISI